MAVGSIKDVENEKYYFLYIKLYL